MNWLKKIWDKHGWILTLPLILVIGFLIIFAVGVAGSFVSLIFTQIPFVIWGNLIGFLILGWVSFYLKSLSRESRFGFGWHLARSIGGFNIFLAIAGILIIAGAISSFTAPGLFTNLWKGMLTILGFGIFLIVMFAYIFVCGEFLVKAVIMFRRKSLSGIFFVAVALVGLSLPGFLIYDRFQIYHSDGNWLGMILMTGAGILIAVWLTFWFVMRAFEIDEWTLEETDAIK